MVDNKKHTVKVPEKKKDDKPPESKVNKFKRLGTSRLRNVMNSLRLLSNCSNTSNYEYTQEQVDYISEKLLEKVEKCLNSFIPKENVQQEKIEL